MKQVEVLFRLVPQARRRADNTEGDEGNKKGPKVQNIQRIPKVQLVPAERQLTFAILSRGHFRGKVHPP